MPTKYYIYKVTRTWVVKATGTAEAISVSKQVLHDSVRAEKIGGFDPALNGATAEYHRSKNWVCECGHTEADIPDNVAMGFQDWSGCVVCPNCNRSMKKEVPDDLPV